MKADYLIVGQGLAGSVLAWTLHRRGKRVVLVNSPHRPAASLVAAGIFNPLTGKKLVRTWLANRLFPFLHSFYQTIEEELGAYFLHVTPIYRPYRSIEEQNTYLARTAEPEIAHYIDSQTDEDYHRWIHNPYGGLHVGQSGWLDVPVFLRTIRAFFRDKRVYFDEEIDYKELLINDNSVEWRGERYGGLICCEGPYGGENPLFSWLPFNLVKGQTLELAIDRYSIRSIVNQGIFIVPLASGHCRVGATYTWHTLDWQTTEEGKAFLEEKLQTLLKAPYQIVGQRAGIRPTTKDRRPLIGLHPVYPRVGIFNGLGTKGVSLAPYFANQFADFLIDRKELDEEVTISRAFSLYYRNK